VVALFITRIYLLCSPLCIVKSGYMILRVRINSVAWWYRAFGWIKLQPCLSQVAARVSFIPAFLCVNRA
jgi:hypothetical protein